MVAIAWDQVGERKYEAGVDHGVLYVRDGSGDYPLGVPWNGLTTITESPSGAEASPQYADNIKYLNLMSAEEFGATVEAFTYPKEFEECDGTAAPQPGVYVHQQTRKTFGMSYRSLIGNDIDNTDHGYKLHLVYGALAAPSEKARTTLNESPEATPFSWELSTTPVPVTGLKPAAHLTIDSTEVDPDSLAALELILYGDVAVDARLPTPDEVIALFDGDVVVSGMPTEPAYNAATDTITIPAVTGVVYQIDGETVAAGPVVITEDTVVTAIPAPGYVFPPLADDDWLIVYS